jgi:hypothetical protein
MHLRTLEDSIGINNTTQPRGKFWKKQEPNLTIFNHSLVINNGL